MFRFLQFLPLFLVLFMATSCGPRSLDDFQEEGEGVIRSLIQDLKSIHTRQDLISSSTKLQRQFDRLVSVMIAAEEFSLSHPEIAVSGWTNYELNDQLRVQLNRIYRLEGGRQIIEKCQEKALYRLDAFDRRHKSSEFKSPQLHKMKN